MRAEILGRRPDGWRVAFWRLGCAVGQICIGPFRPKVTHALCQIPDDQREVKFQLEEMPGRGRFTAVGRCL
jgi:hypothetical protein